MAEMMSHAARLDDQAPLVNDREAFADGPMEPPFLAALNPEQREAAVAPDGPLLVLAGAGTGKTRVLTTRLAGLLWSGRVRPTQVLAVTFTNKAAREMVGRVGAVDFTDASKAYLFPVGVPGCLPRRGPPLRPGRARRRWPRSE